MTAQRCVTCLTPSTRARSESWEGIDDPSTLDELSRARDLAWTAYWASDTVRVSSLASKVLMEGQVRYDSATGGEREQLALVLASTYRVAASCANGFGQRDLALSALTSAKLLAKEADDPVVMALLESTLSWIHERVVRWSADGRPSADRMRLHVGPGGHHLMWE